MFIAMNRFSVAHGREQAFEAVWLGRDTHLGEVPGFVAFHLLRGPSSDGRSLSFTFQGGAATLTRIGESTARLDVTEGTKVTRLNVQRD